MGIGDWAVGGGLSLRGAAVMGYSWPERRSVAQPGRALGLGLRNGFYPQVDTRGIINTDRLLFHFRTFDF